MMRAFPILIWLMGLCLGITLEDHYGISISILLICSVAVFVHIFMGRQSSKQVFILLALAAVGGSSIMHLQKRQWESKQEQFQQTYRPDDGLIVLRVHSTQKGQRVRAKHPESDLDIWAYRWGDHEKLKPGDTIWVYNLKDIAPILNPKEFNFKAWSKRKGITSTSTVRKVKEARHMRFTLWLFRRSADCAAQVGQILSDQIKDPVLLALSYGLFMGEKSALNPDQMDCFTRTGTLHVTAVSGLHVGLVAGFLLMLFPAYRYPLWRWARVLAVLILVWFFVFFTGLKTSAIRAAIMLTVWQLGWTLQRRGQPLNTTAAAGFLMLLCDPNSLFDIGFQLSLSAVLSILIFFPVLDISHHFQSKIIKKITPLLTVSLAVQVLISGVSLYHFHQFPTYFLLGNLIALPLATVLVCGQLLSLIVWFFVPVLSRAIWQILEFCSNMGIGLLEQVSQWPLAQISDIWLSGWMLVLLITLLSSWGISILFDLCRFHRPLWLCSGIVLIILAMNPKGFVQKNELVVYAGPLTGRVDIYINDQLFVYGSPDLSTIQTDYESYKAPRNRHELKSHLESQLRLGPEDELQFNHGTVIWCHRGEEREITQHPSSYNIITLNTS